MKDPKYVTVCDDGTSIRTDRRGRARGKATPVERLYTHNRADRRRIVSKFRKEHRP